MITPDPLPCVRNCSGRWGRSLKKRLKNSPEGPSGSCNQGTPATGATFVTWIFTTDGPSRSTNSAKEPGIDGAPALGAALCPNPCATDTFVPCKLDASSKPTKSEDSATLA